jgi:hypothetical protein
MNGLRPFELVEDLVCGRPAKAVLLSWNGDRYVRTEEEIELSEFVGLQGSRGDRGYGFLSPHSHRWEAVGGVNQAAPWAIY